MAGHFPLSKNDEPTLFRVVESIKNILFVKSQGKADFLKYEINFKGKILTAYRLPVDYVENPKSERAFKLGKVNLKSIKDEHPSLTHQIYVEVHLSIDEKGNVEVKDIFWVA